MNRYGVLFIIFLMLFNGHEKCRAQGKAIDSLKLLLAKANHDSIRAGIYNQLGEKYFLNNPDSAIQMWSAAINISEKQRQTNSGKSPKIFTEILADAYNSSGYIYQNQGNIPKAISYYSKSLELFEQIGSRQGESACHINLGILQFGQGELADALKHFNLSFEIYKALGDKDGMAFSLNNLGNIYIVKGEKVRGTEHIEQSLKIREEIGDQAGIANCLHNLGAIYYRSKEYQKALKYYTRSLEILEIIGDKKGIVYGHLKLGQIFSNNYFNENQTGSKIQNYSLAILHFDKSLALSKELGFPDLIKNSAYGLHAIYKGSGNHKFALENYELYIQMRDSINNESTRKASIKQQLKYEFDKKSAADSVAHAKETEVKNAELAKQQAEIKAKKNQQYALFGGLALVIIFAGFMFNRFKVTQKQKSIIEEQKEVVEEQKKIVEEKQKEILDSIHYAKRIQLAQIPSEKRVLTILKKLKK